MTSTHPPAAAGAHDDGEVKSIKYFGVAVTPDEMRALNEIEAWDDETLRANQDCRSPHDQYIISLVRKKKTFDKDREAREVREAVAVAARAQRLAATAPARAAQARARLERKNADRARAPPATRSSEERKKQRETLRERMQFLGATWFCSSGDPFSVFFVFLHTILFVCFFDNEFSYFSCVFLRFSIFCGALFW